MPSLEDALAQIVPRHKNDAQRLAPLADYVKARLEFHGLPGARGGSDAELSIRGLARSKSWDVAYNFAGKDRLLISLKSIWQNASGTVPNRIDDLMGEAANVQQMSPEIVTGYVLLFDSAADSVRKSDGLLWSAYFEAAVNGSRSGRRRCGTRACWKARGFIKFDSRQAEGGRIPDLAVAEAEGNAFFLSLLGELQLREPAIPFSRVIE